MFFIVSSRYVNKIQEINIIVKILIGTIGINFVLQLITYFNPFFLYSLIKNILYSGYLKGVDIQAARNRYFIEFFDGSLIPFVFFYFRQAKNIIRQFFFIVLIGLSFFLAVISNFRIELIVVLFTIFFSFILITRRKKSIILLIFSILVFFYIGRTIAIHDVGYSSIERLFLEDKEELRLIDRDVFLKILYNTYERQ